MTDTAGIKASDRIKQASAAIKATSGVDEYYALLREVEALECREKLSTVDEQYMAIDADFGVGMTISLDSMEQAESIKAALTHKEPT